MDVITLVLIKHGYVVSDNARRVVLQLFRKVQLQNDQRDGDESAAVLQLNEAAVVEAGAAVERLPKAA